MSTLDPAVPAREALEAIAVEVAGMSALRSFLSAPTATSVQGMMRVVEAHYSLSIDGHYVHPIHIDQAIAGDLHQDAAVRGLQRESVAYLKAQRLVAGKLTEESRLDVAGPSFLKGVHWELYTRVPEEFRWVDDPDGPMPRVRITPGEFRAHNFVSRRRGVPFEEIEPLIRRFRGAYDFSRLSPVDRLIAVPAAHHRLLWIHPFCGGNGRVARLHAAILLQRAGIDGSIDGLWSVSRGLARSGDRYRDLLRAADGQERNELDGRDVLSPRGLTDFARFFLEACRDDLLYMRNALRPEVLVDRISRYVGLRSASMLPGGPLHPESASLLRDVALRGQVPRGEAGRITGMAASEARKVLATLVKEGLLVSDTPKGQVRLGLPAHAAPFLFADLYPGQVVLGGPPHSTIHAP